MFRLLPRSAHRWSAVIAACALLATIAPVTGAASRVSVRTGRTPSTSILPSDAFTVGDARQLTGRRVALPIGTCVPSQRSVCDDLALIDTLDGFDLQPRVTIPFSGPISVVSVTPATVYLEGPHGARIGLGQLVWDGATGTLAGITDTFLEEGTRYTIVVTSGVKDASGAPVDACGGTCRTPFTTRTASGELIRLRRALDDGSADADAGIRDRGPSFVQGGVRDVFPAATVTGIQRVDQVRSDPAAPGAFATSPVPNLAVGGAGYYAFGSFEVPLYQDYGGHDGAIAPTPSSATPRPVGARRVGFDLIVPAGIPPAGGWPVAVFGPGFTRTKDDLFLAADLNALRGWATIATDPAGHGFGPLSREVVTRLGILSTSFLSFGQARDLDGNGVIDAGEGAGPTDHRTLGPGGAVVADAPSADELDGLRSGLIQSVVDNMAMVRMIEGGVDVLGDGSVTLRRTGIAYYGQSFGGIYGTMLLATDPHLQVGVLDVPGGPVMDIARLGGFRGTLAAALGVHRPSLLNGGPGLNGFTESMPLRTDPPVVAPAPGATALQELLAASIWYQRAGSPETFAPLLRLRPPAGSPPKRMLFQTAFADHTVPNPTAGTLYRAGQLLDLVTYYRNDRTPSFASDPHAVLLDPRLAGNVPLQQQMITFIASGGAVVVDPDGPLPVVETPIANPANLDCLHYADPQTGAPYSPGFNQPDCPGPP
jgi:Bacterial Ig-like domain